MQVGISLGDMDVAARVPALRAIGAQVIKFSCCIDREDNLCALPHALEACASIDAAPVVDLRVNPVTIAGAPDALDDLRRTVGHVVRLYAHLCRDWEWWGEAHCPVVTGGKFGAWAYGQTLKIVHEAAHEADATCRVWTGGFGVNLGMSKHPSGVKFLEKLIDAGCARSFEVCNLHPYAHGRMLDVTVEYHRSQLTEMREILNRECAGQPFATSEFGFPTVPRVPRYLHSDRIDLGHGVLALSEREAPAWFDAMLRLFAQKQFRAVCIHTLDDWDADHWGSYCGLRRRGLLGMKPKRQWQTVKEWAR